MPRLRTAAVAAYLLSISACATAVEPVPAPPASAEIPADAEPAEASAARGEPEIQIEGYTDEVARVLAQRFISSGTADTKIALARRGAVRLHAEGPPQGLVDHAPFTTTKHLAVLEDQERPRVVTDNPDVRLLLLVERVDAQPIVISRAPLQRHPSASYGTPPRLGHVVLRPGASVEVVRHREAMVWVTYRGRDVTYSGWIPEAVLGTTATKEPYETIDRKLAYVTRRKTKLVATPDGSVLARIDAEHFVLALTRRVEQDLRLVELQPQCVDDLAYVGFVPARDLYQPNTGSIYGCGSAASDLPRTWGDAEPAPREEIAAGRFLLAPDRPVVVGCVIEPTQLPNLGDGVYAAPTIWGPIEVRLAPEDFTGACGTEP